jgi:hypothetical protein
VIDAMRKVAPSPLAVRLSALSGSIALRDLDTDPIVDLALGVRHPDFAQLLGTSGLAVPDSLGMAPGGGRDLGSATIDVRVRGRPADPASLGEPKDRLQAATPDAAGDRAPARRFHLQFR